MMANSLRKLLTVRVGVAFAIAITLDSVACYLVATHSANQVYDRWLLDSAQSLRKAIRVIDGKTSFDLSTTGIAVFQFDALDKTFFRVVSEHQGELAGDPDLPLVAAGHALVQMADAYKDGVPIRIAAVQMHVSGAADVVHVEVAETLEKRARLTHEILLLMAGPQIALLGASLLVVWFGISMWMRPLTNIAEHIDTRDHDNLKPVPDTGLPQEARALVARINELLQRLQQAMQAQRRFVADAAHQLRTPIAAISLYAENAQRLAVDGQELQALRGLQVSAARAKRLSQQLLTLARAEPESGAQLEFVKLDLAQLARTAGEEWVLRALANDMDFGLRVPEQPVWIQGNESMLVELLSNLIDNAFRYSGVGSKVTIEVLDDPVPKLIVEDDGPGIAVDDRQRIFGRFQRLQSADSHGCGLGLAIVREIAVMHAATVIVTDASSGKGARFVVSFPNNG